MNSQVKRNGPQNKYGRDETIASKLAFNKEWNFFVSILGKMKQNYYDDLREKDVTENKNAA